MKYQLNVINLANEDVIATSGTEFCTNHTTHYYITGNYDPQISRYPETEYNYINGAWSYYSNWSLYTTSNSGLQKDHYYVSNGSGGYVECTEDHDTTNVPGTSH